MKFRGIGGALALALWAQPAVADELRDDVAADLPELMEIYRDLHANPELSFEEVRTAAKLAAIARTRSRRSRLATTAFVTSSSILNCSLSSEALGILDLAHQPDEYCGVDDLINSTKVMALSLLELASSQ